MKFLIVVATVIACASAYEPGLCMRFGLVDAFRAIPQLLSEAISEKWTLSTRPDGTILSSLKMYCANNRFVCGIYDDNGYIAALQIAYSITNFTDAVFDWEKQGYIYWTTTDSSGNTESYWTRTVYFIPEDALDTPAADRLAARDEDKFLQYSAIWVTGYNGKLVSISDAADYQTESNLYEQGYVPWMGRHFFHNITSTSVQDEETFLPYFTLVRLGRLVGAGLYAIGKLPEVTGLVDYSERPERSVVETIVSDGPDWFYELADSPGVVTTHIYFVKYPMLIL